MSFLEGAYPQELSHADLKNKINSAIHETGQANLKIQAVQKYKQSIGIVVESSETRDSLLQSASSWGPKAFQSFASVAPPRERHQILVHDVPVELTMDEVQTGLAEDNSTLTITEKPRWLLKDLSSKRRSSVLVSVRDAHTAKAAATRGLALNGLFLRVSKFIPAAKPVQCYKCQSY
ncbi:hypothetical protein R1sor_014478 [Riccia sorocarpa]|uniref:Uncharacterized protein n=1 Tax=Riccia sorocarpa TaxID=122646 RepID=A0ABD3HCD0_9MARC